MRVYLRAEHLYFWRKGKNLLKDISLTLSSGDRLGLVGPNGSGKSTLLKLLMADLSPESGTLIRTPGLQQVLLNQSLHFSDTDFSETTDFSVNTLWQAALQALQSVQMLEQELRLEEQRVAQGASLDRYRELTEAFEHRGGYQAEANLEKMLLSFGLTQKDQEVITLSGGEKMRLALAMVLSQGPDLLLLDEPTNHLDLSAKKILAKHLLHYSGVVMIASHDRAFLDQVCNQTAFLNEGILTHYRVNYSRAQTLRNKQGSSFSGLTSLTLKSKDVKDTILIAKHLSKKIEDKILLDDIAFHLEAGHKISLLGANGSGKSTLLKMLAGEIESDSPNVDIHWNDSSKLFYCDQEKRGIDDNLPILEQLTVFVTAERARMLLALVGIPKESWMLLPNELSQGQRARAGLAKIIANGANLVLLDEPTNDLDIQMIELLENTLASSEVTCIMVCHDQRLIETISTQTWLLEQGQLKKYATLKDYEQDRPHFVVQETEAIRETPVETPEEKLERLELERIELENQLLDPLMFSERDYLRVRLQAKDLEDELSVLYDQQYPKPLPRYQTYINGIHIGADIFKDQISLTTISFTTNVPVDIKLVIQQSIGHLVIFDMEGSCLLEWSRKDLLKGLIRLCFLYFNVTAIQHQSEFNLQGTMLEPGGENWWTLNRDKFERLEGWVRLGQYKHKKRKGRKRKRRSQNTVVSRPLI